MDATLVKSVPVPRPVPLGKREQTKVQNRQTILERAAGGIRDPEDAATKLEAAVKGVAEVKSSTGAPAVSPKGVNPYRFSVVAKACIRSPVECSTLEPESPRQPRSSSRNSHSPRRPGPRLSIPRLPE